MFQENFAKMLRKRYFRGNLHCLGDRLGKSVPAAGQKNKVRESSRFGSPTHFLRCFHPELPCFALIRHAFPSSRHSVPGIPSGPRIAPERGCPSRSTSMEREDGSWFQRWRSGRRAAGETPAVRPAHSICVYSYHSDGNALCSASLHTTTCCGSSVVGIFKGLTWSDLV